MHTYQVKVALTLWGPFITASSGAEAYGVQKSFYRNHNGKLEIPASHIKGKLRMALLELKDHLPQPGVVTEWFGSESEGSSYEPVRGSLHFSAFSLITEGASDTRTRVSIDKTTYTADQNKLWDTENLYKSGKPVRCRGEISFPAADEEQAVLIAGVLRVGFLWLPSIGSEKSVGYGRLVAAEVGSPEKRKEPGSSTPALNDADALCVRIQPLEPLLLGGVKMQRTNYIASEDVMAGSVVKGALATGLNKAHGIKPDYQPLLKEHEAKYPGYELLVRHFSRIRVSHAFPVTLGNPRPTQLPLSTVQVDDRIADVILSADPYPMLDDKAPVYAIDWKEGSSLMGAADPREISVTRTAINHTSRRSSEGQLFSYSYRCAEEEDEDGNKVKVEWICTVDFSAIEDESERLNTRDQFVLAMNKHLHVIGKRNSRTTHQIEPGAAPPVIKSHGLVHKGLAVVTLQSDAIMLDPADVAELGVMQDLLDLYAAFWEEISMVDGQPTLELKDFFAGQSFQGGYLYHRYLGAAEREEKQNRYTPYYLTNAGSVFKLEVIQESGANLLLEKWLRRGLPLPGWAERRYKQYGREIWQNCPFVPENGYGELAINLKWHWPEDFEPTSA